MTPDYLPPYRPNQDLLDIVKNAPVPKYEDNVKAMKQLKEDMLHLPTKAYTDTQFSEQRAFPDMEDRLTKRMQMEIRKVEEMHAYQMASLIKEMDAHQKGVEELVAALVAQNRELSRRVTDLEWEGITP